MMLSSQLGPPKWHALCITQYQRWTSCWLKRVARNEMWQMWVNKCISHWLDGGAAALILRVVFWWATLNLKNWRNIEATPNRDAKCLSQSQSGSARDAPPRWRTGGRVSVARWQLPHAFYQGSHFIKARISGGGGPCTVGECKHGEVWLGGQSQRGCWEVSASGLNLAALAVSRSPPLHPPCGSNGSCSSASDQEALPCC